MRAGGAVVFGLALASGTAVTILMKALYITPGQDASGEAKFFEKPIFLTFVMFVSMAAAWPLHYFLVPPDAESNPSEPANEGTPLRAKESATASSLPEVEVDAQPDTALEVAKTGHVFRLLILPCVFDLLATALSSVGLIFVSVGVYQLIKCSTLIFTFLLRATVLKSHLRKYMWVGVGINTVAMILVACTAFVPLAQDPSHTSLADADESSSPPAENPGLGILFLLASCVVQALQYVFEEKVMAFDKVHPLIVVGGEGVWGVLICVAVIFPACYLLPGNDGGSFENVFDSWALLRSSSSLMWLIALFFVVVFVLNVACIYVTYFLDAMW